MIYMHHSMNIFLNCQPLCHKVIVEVCICAKQIHVCITYYVGQIVVLIIIPTLKRIGRTSVSDTISHLRHRLVAVQYTIVIIRKIVHYTILERLNVSCFSKNIYLIAFIVNSEQEITLTIYIIVFLFFFGYPSRKQIGQASISRRISACHSVIVCKVLQRFKIVLIRIKHHIKHLNIICI